jgi:hypothetical protein
MEKYEVIAYIDASFSCAGFSGVGLDTRDTFTENGRLENLSELLGGVGSFRPASRERPT